MILKIRQAGETVLRQRVRSLTRDEILSDDIQRLISDMRQTMRDAPGVGLAAPQIGLDLQIAVIEDREEYVALLPPDQSAQQERAPVPFHAIINPTISLEASEGAAEFFEGCLSVTGYRAVVPRARAVRVECLNERAEKVTIQARGWYARILQHEIDHLHGTLYIDRMYSRSFTTHENHQRYCKDVNPSEFRPASHVVEGDCDELAQTRSMLNSRYDDLKSGRVQPIPGDEVEAHFRDKSPAERRFRPDS
jgi:peptide deformylase